MQKMITFKKILCPVDFSKNSREALQYATQMLCSDNDASLYLIHIVDSRVFDYGGPIYEQEIFVTKIGIDQSTRELLEKKLLAEVPKELHKRVTIIVSFGVPFFEIINTAKDNAIDLIVIGTHGRTGLAHMLIGSVAEKVVRNAPCPVLTIKDTEMKRQT